MNELANAEMYLSFSKIYKKNVDLETAFNYVMKLRKAQGEVQHHDAITGTEKQAVANDYNVQLVDGAYFANKAAASILSEFTFASDINKNATEVFPSLTKDNSIAVFLSNDVAWNRKETIQIILPRSDIGVYDRSNNEIESQINEIKSHTKWWENPKIMDAKQPNGEPFVERRAGLVDRSKTIWAMVYPNDYEMVAQ